MAPRDLMVLSGGAPVAFPSADKSNTADI